MGTYLSPEFFKHESKALPKSMPPRLPMFHTDFEHDSDLDNFNLIGYVHGLEYDAVAGKRVLSLGNPVWGQSGFVEIKGSEAFPPDRDMVVTSRLVEGRAFDWETTVVEPR